VFGALALLLVVVAILAAGKKSNLLKDSLLPQLPVLTENPILSDESSGCSVEA